MLKETRTRISVVIPAFNEEASISACLEALKNQTYAPFEVIVVDNGSSDKTEKIAKSYPGVKVVKEKTLGIVSARNRGFNTATGDVIARTDADTRPDTDWLEKIAKVFETSAIDAATGPIYYYDMPAQRLARRVEIAIRSELAYAEGAPSFLAGANMAIRREVWQAVRGKACRARHLHEDLDLAIHVEESGFVIGFDSKMLVATSARRMSETTKDFYIYMKAYEHTYNWHGIRSISLKIPIIMYLPIQPLMRIIHRAYDPKTSKISLKKLVKITV